MNNTDLRRNIRSGLISEGYIPAIDGPSGETFTHPDGTIAWLSWPFERSGDGDNAFNGHAGIRCEIVPVHRQSRSTVVDKALRT